MPPPPMLPVAALSRQCSGAARLFHAHCVPRSGLSPLASGGASPDLSQSMSPSTRLARQATLRGSPSIGPQASQFFTGGSPGSVASYRSGSLPSHSPRVASQVQFRSPVSSSLDITPYEELYGKHPSMFNFDAFGNMVPPSPIDFASPVESPESSPLSGCSEASHAGSSSGSIGFSLGLTMGGVPLGTLPDISSLSTPAAE
mmetsp:Transcript_93781/g.201359  ORF Transcript_93781/g.201359 Transcript_93781/m.201359 type:complete len:201 (+) Transcript_93781:72-674(+)